MDVPEEWSSPARQRAVHRTRLIGSLAHLFPSARPGLQHPGRWGLGTESEMTTPGRYRHYKGNDYEVIGVAKHSETDEEFVVYRPLYGTVGGLWIRPRAMFEESVTVQGETVPRFAKVG